MSNRALAKVVVQNPKDDLTSHTFVSLPSGDIDGPNGMFYIYQCFCHDSRTSESGFHRVCVYIYSRRKIFSCKSIERNCIIIEWISFPCLLNNSHTLEIRRKIEPDTSKMEKKKREKNGWKLVLVENENSY